MHTKATRYSDIMDITSPFEIMEVIAEDLGIDLKAITIDRLDEDTIDRLLTDIGYTTDEIHDNYDLDQLTDEPTLYDIVREDPRLVILPLYLYRHSGDALSTTPFRWDSGQIGYVVHINTPEDTRTEQDLTDYVDGYMENVYDYDAY